MRLFVGIWPPPEVVERLEELPRPVTPGLRWTGPDQWHVTLAFLGEVPDGVPDVVAGALAGAAGGLDGPAEAVMGPATDRLGRGILCLPVDGLGPVTSAVRSSVVGRYLPAEERAFRGHLTLARAGRGGSIPAGLVGAPLATRWPVDRLCLVASHLGRQGARYETVAVATVR